MVEYLGKLTVLELSALFFVENAAIVFLGILFGLSLQKIFSHKRTTNQPIGMVSSQVKLESILAFLTVLGNTFTTLIGFLLWKYGYIIIFDLELNIKAILDVFVLIFVMDIAMYFLHRIAHFSVFYNILHKLHHKFVEPTSLTLFSLHPLENISFGFLWLSILMCYSTTWLGIIVFLVLNVTFGIVGHCGVEPIPDSWKNNFILKYVATGGFHVRHHKNELVNFGFYTNIWDRIFNSYSSK